MELDLQSFVWASFAQLYSLAEIPQSTPSPPPRIWAHIRGRYWSTKIDDISLWPPATPPAVSLDYVYMATSLVKFSIILSFLEYTSSQVLEKPKENKLEESQTFFSVVLFGSNASPPAPLQQSQLHPYLNLSLSPICEADVNSINRACICNLMGDGRRYLPILFSLYVHRRFQRLNHFQEAPSWMWQSSNCSLFSKHRQEATCCTLFLIFFFMFCCWVKQKSTWGSRYRY